MEALFAVFRIDNGVPGAPKVIRGPGAEEFDKAAAQAYEGEGEYRVLRWDTGQSFYLKPSSTISETEDSVG